MYIGTAVSWNVTVCPWHAVTRNQKGNFILRNH